MLRHLIVGIAARQTGILKLSHHAVDIGQHLFGVGDVFRLNLLVGRVPAVQDLAQRLDLRSHLGGAGFRGCLSVAHDIFSRSLPVCIRARLGGLCGRPFVLCIIGPACGGRPQLEGRIVRTQEAIHEALQRGPPIRSGARLFHPNIHGEELRHGIPRQGAALCVVNNLICVGQLAARRIFADEFITFPMAAPERIVVLLGVVRAGNNGRGFVGHSHAVVAEVRG